MNGEKLIEIWAYHGTNYASAEKILSEKIFRYKRRTDHWLGQGVYFFREDCSQAKSWAIVQVEKEKSVDKAAVIEVLIRVKSSEFLNLDTREGMYLFDRIVTQIDEFNKKMNIKLKSNPHTLRCFYCDRLPKKYKLIQRTFPSDHASLNQKSIFKNLNMVLHGVQLCVRDTSIINSDSISICSIFHVPKAMKQLKPRFS